MAKLHPAARLAALTAVSLASAILVGCAQTTALLNQPLAWTPTNTLDLGTTQSHGTPATVQLQAFGDTASNPAQIGENLEEATPRVVTTADPVGPFVTQHLEQLFTQAGYAPGGANADRIISGDVQKFFVREKDTYRGNVVLVVTVRDRSGSVVWRGSAWGTNQTFGRSYHIDNYQQVLSDSLIDAADNLLKNPQFRQALTIKN